MYVACKLSTRVETGSGYPDESRTNGSGYYIGLCYYNINDCCIRAKIIAKIKYLINLKLQCCFVNNKNFTSGHQV